MRRAALTVVILLGLGLGSAVAEAAPGEPPANMSPIAGSIYRARFALCSLDTLDGLAAKLEIDISGLSPAGAAKRLASANERSLGRAAVLGCTGGLLYRFRTDQTIAGLRRSYGSRVTAEKYVAAAYMLVVAVFFGYVLIHTTRIARLARSIESLSGAVRDLRDQAGASSTEQM